MTTNSPGRIKRLYGELKRRRVVGSTAAYVVLAGLLIELSDAVFEALLLPGWATRLVTILLILGLPVVIVLAWFFDVSAAGVTRTEPAEPPAAELSEGARRGVAAAFRRSSAAPVPETAYRGRNGAGKGGSDSPADESTGSPDPERLRRAKLGHVRHELRTPINAILGYSEMLLEDVEEPELRSDLERIRRAGRQLLDRVDGLLSADRVAPDALDDPAAFGEQVAVDLRTPVTAVVGYAEMLMESCEEEGRQHLVPDLERILTAARRLVAASGDIAGIATMVRGGGDVTPTASSALTEGVLAKIRPVRPGEAGAEGVGRLLVVDDNETNRELISRQLARRGYTVATAPDGRQGLALLEQDGFDLILLDVIMPVLDGVETLRRIRSSERFRDTPVIMLSSLDETDSAVRCIEMGASDYVSKPIQPTLLESRIAAALEIRELRRRELAYRERVATDGELIERLLLGALPSALRDRVRAGDLEVEECWEGAAVVRCRLPAAVRSVVGHEAVARVRNIRGLLARFEEVARRHDVDAVLSRPDGFMAVLRPDGSPAEAVIGAARLVLDTIALWDGLPARFAIHVGDTVLGLVGEERPRLEVWGQAVDVVDGLSAGAGEGITLVTPAVQGFLKGRFACTSRGVVDVLGAGQMRVHALTGELEPVAAPDVGSPASS